MLVCQNCASRFLYTFLSPKSSPAPVTVTRRSISKLTTRPNHSPQTNLLHPAITRHFSRSRDAQQNRTTWFAKFGRQSTSRKHDQVDKQVEEDAAKRAILEKALEARQPADLMLRCSQLFSLSQSVALTALRRHYIGPSRSVILHQLVPGPAVQTATGNVKTMSGEFKKSELCMEHKLNVR
jgi:hypothetical protein